MPYTNVGEESIYFACHRSPTLNAPHLILVHGAGGNHQLWGSTVRRLKAAHVYALDLPGHGRSGGVGRCSIPDYAVFVRGFMDALGLERAVIAGHSMGSATALQMALTDPQRVSGLVLVGSGARLRVLPAVLGGILSNYESTVDLICESAYSSRAPRELVRQGQHQMLQVPAQTIHDDFAACNVFDVMQLLNQIRCPALVICGTDDRLTPPKYAAFLSERIAGAELELIDGAGHMVMTEKPELVARAIEAALTRWQA
jgi:pimeloyl-ACP methyl ester carboxylesterase